MTLQEYGVNVPHLGISSSHSRKLLIPMLTSPPKAILLLGPELQFLTCGVV